MKNTVLITGANSGIGLSSVEKFIKEGWLVIGTVRNNEKREELVKLISNPSQLEVLLCELEDADSITQIFKSIQSIDVLINNAGMYAQTHFSSATPQDFDQMFAINTRAPFLFAQGAISNFLTNNKNGLILNVSSTLGSKPAPNTSLYSASKAALISLSKSIAMEFAPSIRSLCINPGVVKTPIHEKVMGSDNATRFQDEISKLHPLGRIGRPEEIAHLLFSLCQEEFAWMTGNEIVIDGGISLTC